MTIAPPPAPPSTISTTSSSPALSAAAALLARLTGTSGSSGCGRLAGVTSFCCCSLLPFSWLGPLAALGSGGAGDFLGLVGILISSEDAPLMGWLSARGFLLKKGSENRR